MLAYLFWHVPYDGVNTRAYEDALLAFHRHLAAFPPSGFVSSVSYRIPAVPWLDGREAYEDWSFVTSSAALEALNNAAVQPSRRDIHGDIASKTNVGHGGLYYHLRGHDPLQGPRAIWLKRPRGIRYEEPLDDIVNSARGFLSCWRKLMVLGPGEEFIIVGEASLDVITPPDWEARVVDRAVVSPDG